MPTIYINGEKHTPSSGTISKMERAGTMPSYSRTPPSSNQSMVSGSGSKSKTQNRTQTKVTTKAPTKVTPKVTTVKKTATTARTPVAPGMPRPRPGTPSRGTAAQRQAAIDSLRTQLQKMRQTGPGGTPTGTYRTGSQQRLPSSPSNVRLSGVRPTGNNSSSIGMTKRVTTAPSNARLGLSQPYTSKTTQASPYHNTVNQPYLGGKGAAGQMAATASAREAATRAAAREAAKRSGKSSGKVGGGFAKGGKVKKNMSVLEALNAGHAVGRIDKPKGKTMMAPLTKPKKKKPTMMKALKKGGRV